MNADPSYRLWLFKGPTSILSYLILVTPYSIAPVVNGFRHCVLNLVFNHDRSKWHCYESAHFPSLKSFKLIDHHFCMALASNTLIPYWYAILRLLPLTSPITGPNTNIPRIPPSYWSKNDKIVTSVFPDGLTFLDKYLSRFVQNVNMKFSSGIRDICELLVWESAAQVEVPDPVCRHV